MPEPQVRPSPARDSSPDYARLVRYLVEPFLETPESLSVDCEKLPSKPRVWIRMAFEGADKGRVYGRGGRNIQAIRTVIEAAAQAAGQSVYLDVYGSNPGSSGRESTSNDRGMSRKTSSRRSSPPRTASRSRTR